MFQPTNESYIQSTVEATMDRHMGETEEERLMREGQSYHEGGLSRGMHSLLASLGRLMLGIGKRLENANAPDAVLPRRQTVLR